MSKVSLASCLIIFTCFNVIHCQNPTEPNFVEVYDVDVSTLTPRAPKDPAINQFPKDPSPPYLPTCFSAGFYRDPYNCVKFYDCKAKDAIPVGYYCKKGLIFDITTNTCRQEDLVEC